MRLIFIILLVFLVSLCFAQKPIAKLDVKDSNYYVLAGAIAPSWDTASNHNKWVWISTNSHSKIHFLDTITQTSTGVTLYFDTTFGKAVSLLVVEDEKTSRMVQSTANFEGKAGAQYYTNGPYLVGASVGLANAALTFTSIHSLSLQLYWDGSQWVFTDAPYNAISLSVSQKPTVSWSSGVMDVSALPFNMKATSPVITNLNVLSIDSLFGFIPTAEFISPTRFLVHFWDSRSAIKYTAGTPVQWLGVNIDFGSTFTLCNPVSEDFGFDSNFWVYAIMKR